MIVLDVNCEVELKLAPLTGTLRDIGRAAARAGAKRRGKSRLIRSTYFDTAGYMLRDSGYVLRVRNNGPDNIQTVKSIRSGDQGLGRGEWEAKVRGDRPVANAAANSPLSNLLNKPNDWEALQPIFTVEVHRDTYLFVQGETVIEVALDNGVVRREGGEHSIVEAELELKKGEPQALPAFARDITAAVPCLVSLTSKAEWGYRLLAGEAMRPATNLKYSLRREMSTAEVIRAIGHTCLAALFHNLALLIAGGGVEALHQSRVCLRRLRAILSLFKSALGWEDGKATIQQKLKWLSGVLRDGRELDVLITSVLAPAAAANPDIPGFEPLLASFQAHRDRAYVAIMDNLRSRRLSELSLDLVGGLLAPIAANAACREAERQKLARQFVATEVQRRLKSLLRDSRKIERLAPAEQHRIRLRAKKLRYMIEPFGDLIPPKRFREGVSSLHGIQDALGDLNDCEVNRKLVLAYATEVLAGDGDDHSPLVAAGFAASACMGRKATAISRATAARQRLARLSDLRIG
jgi:inorganic triphosphatase YgiF